MSEDGGGETMCDGGINEESSPTDPQTRSTANANIHVNIHTNTHADTHTQTHPHNSDAATEQRPRNLLESSSLWTRLTFSWVMPLLNKGLQNQDLKEIDLPHLAEKETSEFNLRMMNDLWAQEQRIAAAAGRSPNLKMAILKLALAKMWFVQPMMLTLSVARIGQSLALGQLVEYFEGNLSRTEGYLYASIVAITALITLFANHNAFFHTWKTGMQLRIAAIACIYDKTLRLKSVYSSNETNSGQVMNLASNDVERFILSTVFLLHIFWGPMEAVAVLIIGILSVGPAFAAGYVLLFCFIIVQFYLGIRFVHFRSKIAQITDSRVTMVSQVIAGIRVVKMMGWELAFLNKIKDLRQKETSAIQDATKLKAWNEAIFFAANTTVSAVIFLVHVYSGNELTARHVFTTFTLLNVVQLTMTKFFAFGIMANSEVKVSIERIQKFLETEEINQNKASSTLDTNDYFLQLFDVTCHWSSSGETSKSTLPELERSMDGGKGGASTKAGVAQDAGDKMDKTAVAVANIDMNRKPGAMY